MRQNLFTDVLLIVISAVFFILFTIKACIVPITYDESFSCLNYSQLSVKSIIFYDDSAWPTNHVLNTLMIKLFTYFGGINQIVCRIPTVLFSLIYLVFAIRLCKILSTNAILRVFFLLLFLCNPFVNDFFSLARGYGMAISCMMASIYFLVRYMKELNNRDLIWCMIFTLLSVESNFSWLIYFVSVNMVLVLLLLYNRWNTKAKFNTLLKPGSLILLFDIITFLLVILPVTKMVSTDQFKYWTGTSFFNETLNSMYTNFIYTQPIIKISPEDALFLWSMVFGFCFCFGVGIVIFNKRKTLTVLSVASFLFGFTLLVNFCQYFILKTPFLVGRTSILYHPLIAFIFCAAVSYFHFYARKSVEYISIGISIILVAHIIITTNLVFFREWFFDKNALDVINYLDTHRKPGETIDLNTGWILHPAINFYKESQNLTWLKLQYYHKENQRDELWTYYYANNDENDILKVKYTSILEFDGNSRILYKLTDSLNVKK